MRFIFIDVEASATTGGFPTEIGISQVRLPARSIKTEAKLICHQPWLDGVDRWSEHAADLTGIDRAALLTGGRPVREVCAWLDCELRGQTAFSDAAGFDEDWIRQVYAAVSRSPSFLVADIKEAFLAVDLDKARFRKKLDGLMQRPPPHRAGPDAERWARLFAESIASH